jgi:hypothetical protein
MLKVNISFIATRYNVHVHELMRIIKFALIANGQKPGISSSRGPLMEARGAARKCFGHRNAMQEGNRNCNYSKETVGGFRDTKASYAIIRQSILNKHPLAQTEVVGGHINSPELRRAGTFLSVCEDHLKFFVILV